MDDAWASSFNVFVICHIFCLYTQSFVNRHLGPFEPRKQKGARAIASEEEEDRACNVN